MNEPAQHRDNPAYGKVVSFFETLTAGTYENKDAPGSQKSTREYFRLGTGTLPSVRAALRGGKGTLRGDLVDEYDPIIITIFGNSKPEDPVDGVEILEVTFVTRKRNGPKLIVTHEYAAINYNNRNEASVRHAGILWFNKLFEEHFPLHLLLE